ncbi:hypothetical protein J6590_023708 [Homalodisca vitripennis]|nr:hypothetical protein J6590_023708 [Homalodisca vitripennis]
MADICRPITILRLGGLHGIASAVFPHCCGEIVRSREFIADRFYSAGSGAEALRHFNKESHKVNHVET